MSGLQVIHLATAHRAGDPRIFQKECRTLAGAGYEVSYVLPHERDEVKDGVQLLGVPQPRNGRERILTTTRAVLRRATQFARDRRRTVLHAHDAELLPGLLMLQARGWKTVYDAHEDTPKQMRYQHWIPAPLRPLASLYYQGLEAMAGRLCEAVVAAEPLNARRFPDANTVLVHNYPIISELETSDPHPYAERANVITYVGALTEVRGIREMMHAVDIVPATLDAELRLAGPFHPASLADSVCSFQGNAHTRFLGYLDRLQVAEELSRAKIGIVTLHPTPKYLESYPTKLFEYMAVGLPVIASDFPGWRHIVQSAGCGLLVDPLDPQAISTAITWLLGNPSEAEKMGMRGRAAVETRYSWEQEAPRLLALYERLTRQMA
ncbi:glycosyltransferase family 4 protein [soil metagenome]